MCSSDLSPNPSTLLLHVGAITVVLGGALTVRLLAMLLPDGGFGTPAPDAAGARSLGKVG